MNIIFLDIDGVLNSNQFFQEADQPDFGAGHLSEALVKNLNALVAATGARIVISSSWRSVWDPDEIREMLVSKGFKHPEAIIDQTGHAFSGFRGKEIQDWLENYEERLRIDDNAPQIANYVILDDSTDFTTDQMEHFVKTDPQVGLTPQDAQKAIRILNQSA